MAGMEVFASSGKLQFSSAMQNYFLKASGSGVSGPPMGGNTVRSSIIVPNGNLPGSIVAIQCARAVAYMGISGSAQDATFAVDETPGQPYRYFIFVPAQSLPATPRGVLMLWDAQGVCTFNSAFLPMRITDLLGVAGNPHAHPASAARPGRSLAVASMSWSGHRLKQQPACWDGGQQTFWEPGTFCQDVKYQNDAKLYGGLVSPDGASAATGLVSWDDVLIDAGTWMDWQYQPQDFTIHNPLLVVDVTGIPDNTTYF